VIAGDDTAARSGRKDGWACVWDGEVGSEVYEFEQLAWRFLPDAVAEVRDGQVVRIIEHEEPGGLTYLDAAWRIACEFGLEGIEDPELDYILWEHTAFPVAPWTHVADQLRQVFTVTHAVADQGA
jgi:hypothetical protein